LATGALVDRLEQSYAELLRAPAVNTPREQARIQQFHRKLESFRVSLQPGIAEEIRRKAEKELDLLAFSWNGVQSWNKRLHKGNDDNPGSCTRLACLLSPMTVSRDKHTRRVRSQVAIEVGKSIENCKIRSVVRLCAPTIVAVCGVTS
jgi:hypothetical protein